MVYLLEAEHRRDWGAATAWGPHSGRNWLAGNMSRQSQWGMQGSDEEEGGENPLSPVPVWPEGKCLRALSMLTQLAPTLAKGSTSQISESTSPCFCWLFQSLLLKNGELHKPYPYLVICAARMVKFSGINAFNHLKATHRNWSRRFDYELLFQCGAALWEYYLHLNYCNQFIWCNWGECSHGIWNFLSFIKAIM